MAAVVPQGALCRGGLAWKAGVTHAPLLLCVPAQLKEPRRAWHLQVETGKLSQCCGGSCNPPSAKHASLG